MHGVHVRRTCTPHMCDDCLWHMYVVHECFSVVVMAVNVGCCSEARMGREWSRDWLKERQSEKGMEEFIMAELAADVSISLFIIAVPAETSCNIPFPGNVATTSRNASSLNPCFEYPACLTFQRTSFCWKAEINAISSSLDHSISQWRHWLRHSVAIRGMIYTEV